MKNKMVVGALHMVLASLILWGCQGLSDAERARMDMEKMVAQLAAIEKAFVRDGASDYGVVAHDSPCVKELRSCEAVPLLISHLVDEKPTKVVYKEGDRSTVVPLGYLCLDLLLQMSALDSLARGDGEWGDDGGWESHANERFYFPPDVLTRRDGRPVMRRVQQAWQEALDSGQLRFVDVNY